MNAVQQEQSAMKFVLKGRTFDTASSTVAAINRGISEPMYNNVVGDCETRYEVVLYRTAKGAFFLHDHSTYKFVKGGKPVTEDTARELTPEKALEWIAECEAVVMDGTGLPLPPEA
jgi:hypothetical protein